MKSALIFALFYFFSSQVGVLAAPANCIPGRTVCGLDSKKVCQAQNNSASGYNGAQDPISCLPQRSDPVCSVLEKMSQQFGQIYVVSADRSRNNSSRGGAKHSMHLFCRAVDVVYEGRESRGKQQQVAQFLKSLQSGSGMRYNVYCSGRAHVDNSVGLPNSYSSCIEKKNYPSGGGKSFARDPSRVRRARG